MVFKPFFIHFKLKALSPKVGGRFAISTKSPKSAFSSVCDQTPSKKRCNRTLCVRKYILSTVGEDVYCWQEPKFARMQYCSFFLLCEGGSNWLLAINVLILHFIQAFNTFLKTVPFLVSTTAMVQSSMNQFPHLNPIAPC